MSTTAPPLEPELIQGLRRLKLATIRAQAPEVLQIARTQRWPPEDVLRALVANKSPHPGCAVCRRLSPPFGGRCRRRVCGVAAQGRGGSAPP